MPRTAKNPPGKLYARGPKHERSIEIACKRYSHKALEILAKALDETKTPDLSFRDRIIAAKEILDRGYGKPRQAIDQKVEVSVTGVTQALDQARARALALHTQQAIEQKIEEASFTVISNTDDEPVH